MMAAQLQKGALLGELSDKLTTTAIKEVNDFGVTFEYNAAGKFTGAFTAAYSKTNNVHMKNDGTMQWHSKAFLTTPEGDLILGHGEGTGKVTGPETFVAEGELIFITKSPKLSWLDHKKFRLDATGNPLTGEERTKFFAV